SPAGNPDIPVEIHQLAIEAVSHAERAVRPVAAGTELRQTAIRLILGYDRAVDRLVVLQAAEQRPVVTIKIEQHAAIEVRDARGTQASPQVLEIVAVGCFPEVDQVAPAISEQRAVVEVDQMPVAVGEVIVRQVLELGDTVHALRQVAELRTYLQAAVGEKPRSDRRIVVVCNVPVPGYAQFVAASPCAAEFGRQYAGLSGIGDRERQPRRIQDRHSLESQLDVPGGARSLARVEVDVTGLQQPVFRFRRAGRVTHAVQVYGAVIADLQHVRGTARIVLSELELRALEADATQLIRKLRGVAGDLGPGILVANAAIEQEGPVSGVVDRAFGTGQPVAAAHQYPAGHSHRRVVAEAGFEIAGLDRK